MKQESVKKTPKWLLPVIIAAALLVVVGIVLAIFLPKLGQGGEPEAIQSKLYWNVDRLANVEQESGMSIREPGADGMYAIRFAVGGEQVEYKVTDKRLVNAIDLMDVMGLVFDENGLIVDALDPKLVATEVAKDVFAKTFNGTMLLANSSQAMNGMPIQAEITEKTGIWDVSPDAEVVGQKGEPQLLDMVTIYADANGNVTDIFIVKRAKEAGVYYRIGTYYDANLASTTREPDKDGVYTMLFAHEGEQVELKCKDANLVTNIDALSDSKVQMGLLFDEEGYIVERVSVAEAVKGKILYSMYDVTAVAGNMITAESKWSSAKDKGEIVDFEIPEECDDIFVMETNCGADFVGQRVEGLQVGDRVYVYSDFENNPVLIFITHRGQDYPIYYNLSRKYDSEKKETKRVPVNGWYVFEMAAPGGAEVTLKTKDKKLASRVDAFSPQYMGVKATNGIIENVCSPTCVGGRSGFSGRYITETLGTIYRVASGSDLASGSNLLLASNCKIYDITGDYGVPLMSETTLQMYDRISLVRNAANEIAFAFVTDRYMEGAKIYENVSRQYSATNKATKREPDADGYYVYDMICEGKEVQVKTKNKKMANYIDKVSSRFLALKVSGGIVKDATSKYYSGIKYGARVMSGVYFDYIDADRYIHYYSISDGKKVPGVSNVRLADNYVTYNHSVAYQDHRGEKTTLKKGDYIYAVWDRMSRTISRVFVRTREINPPLYWHVKRQYSDTTKETTRQPAADGYYYIDLVANGEIKTFKTKSKDVASRVDAYAYAFGMATKGDTILFPVSATYVKGIEKHLYRFTYVKEIKGNTVITETTDATNANFGKDLELKFTKNSKIYDVCTYSEGFGKTTTLNIGDRVVSYVDEDEKVVYCFVDNKCTREAGYRSVCEHCQEEVTWTPFLGTIATRDMHYYLPNDRSRTQRQIGFTKAQLAADDTLVQYKTCFDLNGHTLTSTSRNFLIYSELNLMDSVGGGKLISADDATALRLSFGNDAKLNIYGGTYEKAEGVDAVGSGALIYGGGCTVNIYDGTFIGGNATTGGIAHLGTNSVLNIEGGNFVSGKASDAGNSIYILNSLDAPSTLAMRNCKIDGGVAPQGSVKVVIGTGVEIGNAKGTGMELSAGQLLDVSKMDTTSSVYVNANGVFTTERDDIDTLKDCFKPIDEYGRVVVDGKALRYDIVVPMDPETDTQKRVEKWVEKVKAEGAFAPGGKLPNTCPICNGVGVVWEKTTGGITTAAEGGHYYFNSTDGEFSYRAANLLANPSKGVRACVYLNDQKISMEGRMRVRGELNIFGDGTITKVDTDKVSSDGTKYAALGMFDLDRDKTVLNIYGGTYTSQVKLQSSGNNPHGTPIFRGKVAGSTVNVYGGTFQMAEGAAGAVLHGVERCAFNLYNGTVIGGTGYIDDGVTYGGAFYQNGGSLNILGGTVTGGKADSGKTIYANGTEVTLKDAAVDGVELAGQSALTLSGKVQLPELKLATGVIADITELDTASSITVSANGVFTTERDDIESVKNCFKPANTADVITVDGKALRYNITVPADPETDTQTRVDNWVKKVKEEGAFGPDGELPNTCPVCNGVGVTWEKHSGSFTTAKEGGHYYFSTADGTLTYNSMNLIATPFNGVKACIYLNDHDIAINGRIRLRNGEMNIFGDGNVTKQDNDGTNKDLPLFDITTYSTGEATLNIYGGTYTSAVTAANSTNGVPVIGITDVGQGTTVNLYGGTFSMAQGTVGATIRSEVGGAINLLGGTVNSGSTGAISAQNATVTLRDTTLAGAKLTGQSALTLIGKVEIPETNGGLQLARGVIADITELDTASSITVSANGVFTTERDDIDAVKNCFKAAGENDEITVSGKALSYKIPVPMDPETDVSKRVDNWVAQVKADGAFEDGGTTPITCPICNGEAVSWEKHSGSFTTAKEGGHYYFSTADGTLTYNSMNLIATPFNGVKACIYLNDHDIAINGRIRLRNGEMNIFGDGNVTKQDNDGGNKDLPLFDITTYSTGEATLNIYGGTYTSAVTAANSASGVPVVGITSVGQGTTVNLYGGKFSMAQGTVGATIRSEVGGAINLLGGTVNGGSTGAISAQNATVTLRDTTVAGVELTGQSALTLIGKVEIPETNGGLKLAEGVIADITELATDSAIYVSASGVFTTERDDIETVKACFTPAEENALSVVGKALHYGQITPPAPPVPEMPEITPESFTTGFDPAANSGYAYCEACYKQAKAAGKSEDEAKAAAWQEWTAYDASLTDDTGNMFASGHFYLTKNEEAAKKRFFSPYGNYTVCLNLNGFNVTKTAESTTGPIARVADGATMNIMDAKGTAVVTGRNSGGNNAGSAISVEGVSTCNIYGGTFRRTTDAAGQRTITVNPGSTVNIYSGTVDAQLYDAENVTALAADQNASRAGMAIFMEGTEEAHATLNIHGGTVIGGTLKDGATVEGAAAVMAGNSANGYADFTMTDGTITGGTNNDVTDKNGLNTGAVSVHASATFTMTGGTITGGTAVDAAAGSVYVAGAANISGTVNGAVYAAEGANLTLSGAAAISGLTLADGVVANIDQLAATAQITVAGEKDKVISNVSTNADAVKDCFTAGEGLDVVVGATGALTIAEETVAPPVPPVPTEPGAAEKAAADAWVAQVKTEGAFAENGTLPTTCPFCDGAVTWEAKSGNFTTAQEGGHYYFSNNGTITYNSQNLIATPFNGVKACVYLNDHSISIKGRIRLRAGEMNIFGDGSITKVDNDSSNKELPLLNVTTYDSATATLNIYGGTYTSEMTAANAAAGVPVISVTTVGQGTAVNIYGGTFTVAQGALGKAIDSTLENTTTTIYNGTFNGDINLAAGSLSVYNGTINGEVSVAENTVLNLAGKPVITGLTLNGAAVANIDELDPQAQITVNAAHGKVLSNASDNAETVKECFLVPQGLQVEVVEKKLVVKEPNPAQFVLDWIATNGAAFRAEDKLEAGATVEAPCPFCSPNANVTWTAAKKFENTAAGAHLYQCEAYAASSTNFITTSGDGAARCVYLNGFDTTSDGLRIRGRRDLNIIAYGSTLTRTTKADGSSRAECFVQGEGSVRIYGGTYISNDATVPTLRITSSTNVMSIYDATFTNSGNNVFVASAATMGTTSLYNCTFTGATGYKAIALDKEGVLNIHNGTVTGGMELATNVTLNLTGAPVIDSGVPAAQQGTQSQDESSQSVKN